MFCEWVKTACKRNKIVFYMMAVMIKYEMINTLERDIIQNIALVSEGPGALLHDPGNYSCPYRARKEDLHPKSQHASFYWTQRQIESLNVVINYIPIATMVFGGICSDKFGGHRVMLVGLAMSGVIMSVSYLNLLGSNYVFIVMYALRRICQGFVFTALYSLVGKLARSHYITLYLGLLFVAKIFGGCLGYVVTIFVFKWKILSRISGVVGFVSALWWFTLCRSSRFPKVPMINRIPCKNVVTSISFYVTCLLMTSIYVFSMIESLSYEEYTKEVLFFEYNPEWVVVITFCFTEVFSYLIFAVSSDYIVHRRFLPISVVRRVFFSLSVVSLFSIIAVFKVIKCNPTIAVGCCVALHFITPITVLTAMATIMDFSPAWSGTITGVVFTFSLIVSFPLPKVLRDIFVSGYSKGDINSWIQLFFTEAFIGLFLSLPFICCGINKFSCGVEVPIRKTRVNDENDGVDSQERSTISGGIQNKSRIKDYLNSFFK